MERFWHFLPCDVARRHALRVPARLVHAAVDLQSRAANDFAVGEVSEKFKKEFRVWIIRNQEGFYAIFAKCTHLGCTPRWLAAENKFKCPCHGSGYYKDGVNFEGPAPRPMDRVRITRAEDGQILVDVSVQVSVRHVGQTRRFLEGLSTAHNSERRISGLPYGNVG